MVVSRAACFTFVTTLVACGRLGFDAADSQNPSDASPSGFSCGTEPAGSLDRSFAGTGVVIEAAPAGSQYRGKRLSIDDSDRIVMAVQHTGTDASFGIARFDDSGIDLSFGEAGFARVLSGNNQSAFGLVRSNGRWLASGWVLQGADFAAAVAAFDDSGQIDTSYGADGTVITQNPGNEDRFYELSAGPDGTIVTVGRSDSQIVTGRFLASGEPDDSVAPGGVRNADGATGTALGLSVRNNDIYLSGQFSNEMGFIRVDRASLARDLSFASSGLAGAGIPGNGNDILQIGDQFLLAGSQGGVTPQRAILARFAPNGQLDTNFGVAGFAPIQAGTGNNIVHAMATDSMDRILYTLESDDLLFVGRLLRDGSIDTSFGNAGYAVVGDDSGPENGLRGIALDSQGRIAVSGWTSTANGVDLIVARVCP